MPASRNPGWGIRRQRTPPSLQQHARCRFRLTACLDRQRWRLFPPVGLWQECQEPYQQGVLRLAVGRVAAERRKLVDQPAVDRDGEHGATRAGDAKHIAGVDDLLQDGQHHLGVMMFATKPAATLAAMLASGSSGGQNGAVWLTVGGCAGRSSRRHRCRRPCRRLAAYPIRPRIDLIAGGAAHRTALAPGDK